MGAMWLHSMGRTKAGVLADIWAQVREAGERFPKAEWSVQVPPEPKEYKPEDQDWPKILQDWRQNHQDIPSSIWAGQARIHT